MGNESGGPSGYDLLRKALGDDENVDRRADDVMREAAAALTAAMTVFAFIDMHSGGGTKAGAEVWYVKARTENEARERFTAHTGRDPDHVTCKCCGPDFALTVYDALDAWHWPRPGEAGAAVVP